MLPERLLLFSDAERGIYRRRQPGLCILMSTYLPDTNFLSVFESTH